MILRGRVKFPIGGKVRERLRMQIWCDSKTDSIVWMKEEKLIRRSFCVCFCDAFCPRSPLSGGFCIIGRFPYED